MVNHVLKANFINFPHNKLKLAGKYISVYAKLSVNNRPKECVLVYDSKSEQMYLFSENNLFTLEKKRHFYFKKVT